jgi:hypothetical protein
MSVTATPDSAMAETQQALLALHSLVSWRGLARVLDVPHGILHAIGTGRWEHVGWPTVRKVRVRLGLGDLGDITEAFVCPSCGDVHTGDCHGQPVAAVVVLAPGEAVRRVPIRRPLSCAAAWLGDAARPRVTPDPAAWTDYVIWRAERVRQRGGTPTEPIPAVRCYDRSGRLVGPDWRICE